MPIPTTARRSLTIGAASVVGAILAASPAFAHHCFIPMYSLQGPTASANWFVVTAEFGAALEAGFETGCPAARDAGYAALREARLPVGLKIMEKMTIADPKGTGRMAPNGADGRGLEYFAAGSTLPEEVLSTYIAAASGVDC
ncbi:MAG TPA: hypothetical protein GXZ45_08040 [Propionibacterium sp.]|nr:hypothetical protein [Propionibacterium sp.]